MAEAVVEKFRRLYSDLEQVQYFIKLNKTISNFFHNKFKKLR